MDTHGTPSTDDLWAALQTQQEQITRLEAQLAEERAERLAMARRPAEQEHAGVARARRRLSRAGLFRTAAAGAIGLAGAEVLRP